VVIVDDHLALLAATGRTPNLGAEGPVATTYSFQYRLARAVADSTRSGALSRRVSDPARALRRILSPPANRLVVVDPRVSLGEAVGVAVKRGANLLLAELIGAARHYGAAVRVTPANQGKAWNAVMAEEGIDFATVDA
jgi:hypothetical protein